MDKLTLDKREFWEDLLDYVKTEGKPPPIEDCGRSLNDVLIIPDSVGIVAPIGKEDGAKPKKSKQPLRRRIVDLIQKGESDLWRIDICLADAEFGSILRCLDLLCRDGIVIRQPDGELLMGI